MKTLLITITLVLFFSSIYSKSKVELRISATIYITHNSVFTTPEPIINYVPCIDCSGFQKYPVFGIGGGFLVDKIYKNQFILRTGFVYSNYTFDSRQSKEIAQLYLNTFPNVATQIKSIHKLFQIPIQFGYNYKSVVLNAGILFSFIDLYSYESINYYDELQVVKKNEFKFTTIPIPQISLKYKFPKNKWSILGSIDIGYKSDTFYKLGLEYPILNKN